MCFNANISITTFIIGLAAICIGLINNIIPWNFAIFYFSIIFMQFLEFLAWIYINNVKINKIISIVMLLLLYSHLFTACLLLYDNKNLFYIYIFLLIIIYIYLIFFRKNKTNYNINIKDNHLQWNFLNMDNKYTLLGIRLYILFIGSIIINKIINYYDKNKWYYYILIFFFINQCIFYTTSFYLYNKYNYFGSLFCFYTNIFSFIIIFFSLYK